MFHPQSYQVIYPQSSQVIHPQSAQVIHPQSSQVIHPQSEPVVLSFLPTDDPLECLNKALTFMCTTFASIYPSNNTQLETSSNPVHQIAMPERQTLHCVGNCSTCNDHIARQYTQSKKVQWLKQKMMLAQLQEIGIQLSKEQLAILANTGERVYSGPGSFKVITNALFRSDGIDLYDSDCDEVPTAQVSFMANLSSYGSYVLSEVPHSETYQNDMANQSVQAMPYFEQIPIVDYTDNEITSDSNIISVIAKEHVVISVIDDEEALILEEESLSKMLDKQNDPISIEKKINISPIDYSKLNKIKDDFGTRFVTQKELSAEQAF
ncbi:hypothetical protein Tco_0785800 [Tanacetum coccineum]